MIRPGEHVSIFGLSGCGKSTLTRKMADIFSRKIIFDRMAEWTGKVQGAFYVNDFDSFARIYKQVHPLASFTIIFKPRAGMPQDELITMTNDVLGLIYRVEKHVLLGIALIFEEVWLYAPLMNIPRWFQEILLTGRHYKISVVGNAQRPATVSKTIVSQSRHVFIGQFFEARDRKYFRETLGDLPELENPPQKYEFIWYRADADIIRVKC